MKNLQAAGLGSKKAFIQRPSEIALCIEAGGSVTAGVLLYRLQWQMRLAKERPPDKQITDQGHVWVLKPRAEWMIDTGLSRHEYDGALKLLKRRGLVVETYLKPRFESKFQVTALRLTKPGEPVRVPDATTGDHVRNPAT